MKDTVSVKGSKLLLRKKQTIIINLPKDSCTNKPSTKVTFEEETHQPNSIE